MVGFNSVGIFYDCKGEIAAAYAGSPDFIVDIFRRSMDPEYVPVAVYERLRNGKVCFEHVSFLSSEGAKSEVIEPDSLDRFVKSWSDISCMSWKDVLEWICPKESIDWTMCPLYAERIAYEQSRLDVGE